MSKAPFISIISPVYRAEEIVPELVKRVEEELNKLTDSYEIILVEDCSPDNSWEVIRSIANVNGRVKGLRFSRNFGQHMAIKAGLEQANGDCCIVMDCDLQDDPAYFANLIEKWQLGADIVYTVKEKRAHSLTKNITAKIFNKVFNFLADNDSAKSKDQIGAYSLISRKVVDAFVKYNDYQFHYLMVLRWLGFESDYIEIMHKKRFLGSSSYNFKNLLDHAIVGIVYQSDKLLRLSIYIGFLFSFLSLLAIILIIVLYFTSGFQSGWASSIVILLFATGIILTAIGIMGLYIGKMFEQVKNRPQYIIDKRVNL